MKEKHQDISENAWNVIQPAIIAKQSTDGIDTVSGATYSSEGILYGAKSALEQL